MVSKSEAIRMADEADLDLVCILLNQLMRFICVKFGAS